jgi:hypothetical protein
VATVNHLIIGGELQRVHGTRVGAILAIRRATDATIPHAYHSVTTTGKHTVLRLLIDNHESILVGGWVGGVVNFLQQFVPREYVTSNEPLPSAVKIVVGESSHTPKSYLSSLRLRQESVVLLVNAAATTNIHVQMRIGRECTCNFVLIVCIPYYPLDALLSGHLRMHNKPGIEYNRTQKLDNSSAASE